METQFPQFNQIDDAIDGSNGIAKKCEDIDACFIAGTLITTPSGYKPIGQIKAGDLVLSKDPATGKEDYKTVKQAIVRHTNALVRIIAQKDTIFATPEHPFWVNNTWVEAAKIKIGDKLTLAATNDFTATNAPQSLPYLARSSIEAEQVQLIDTTATVYNFEVEDFHTYFVGKQAVWVHNDPEHFGVNNIVRQKTTIKYVNNYNVKNSGIIADFIDENNKLLGKLYKSAKNDKIQYTFKFFKSDGNILKINNQLISLEDGILKADLNLEKLKQYEVRGVGTTIFDDAINYFGNRVDGIAGLWEANNPNYINGISDNLTTYRNSLAAGKTPQEAAKLTQTGKWAGSHEFKNVEFIGDNSINSTEVNCIFKK